MKYLKIPTILSPNFLSKCFFTLLLLLSSYSNSLYSVVETWEAGEGIVKSEQEMWPEINSIIDNWGEDPS